MASLQIEGDSDPGSNVDSLSHMPFVEARFWGGAQVYEEPLNSFPMLRCTN